MAERTRLKAWMIWPLIALGAAALSIDLVAARMSGAAVDQALLAYSLSPRIVTAIVAGAALGLSGALLQSALDNPLAEPSTLGVFAGAQLALALAALFTPSLGALGREAAALGGGGAAAALVLALAWRRGLDPVTVVLCGMVVAMVASSLTAALILARGDYLFALLIWGGGSLAQESWRPAAAIAATVAATSVAAMLLARPLGVLAAGEQSARSLGASAPTIRIAALGLGVLLATSVAAEVGLIAFVGLAAPALARLSGARTIRQTLVAAPLVGATLLWLTDVLIQHVGSGETIPAGAATAVLGAPLLMWMLPRLQMADRPSAIRVPRARAPGRTVALLGCSASLAIVLALALGRFSDGWSIATGDLFASLAPFRWPRMTAAAAAGAMLAAAGVILQRMTANPLAGPEVLGVGAGAGVGLAVVLVVAGATSWLAQFAGAAAGAAAALALMLAISGGGRLGPERMLLAGAAISALCLAGLNAVIATGSRSAFALLGWISGATDALGPAEALSALVVMAVLVAPLPALLRWLEMLPLGGAVAGGLGLNLPKARLALTGLAALLTAAAALVAGPLSFVGLVAPHIAFSAGLTRPAHHLAGAIFAGVGLMVTADLLARTVIFPYQLPLGLFASLIGGSYLVLTLRRR